MQKLFAFRKESLTLASPLSGLQDLRRQAKLGSLKSEGKNLMESLLLRLNRRESGLSDRSP